MDFIFWMPCALVVILGTHNETLVRTLVAVPDGVFYTDQRDCDKILQQSRKPAKAALEFNGVRYGTEYKSYICVPNTRNPKRT